MVLLLFNEFYEVYQNICNICCIHLRYVRLEKNTKCIAVRIWETSNSENKQTNILYSLSTL